MEPSLVAGLWKKKKKIKEKKKGKTKGERGGGRKEERGEEGREGEEGWRERGERGGIIAWIAGFSGGRRSNDEEEKEGHSWREDGRKISELFFFFLG